MIHGGSVGVGLHVWVSGGGWKMQLGIFLAGYCTLVSFKALHLMRLLKLLDSYSLKNKKSYWTLFKKVIM